LISPSKREEEMSTKRRRALVGVVIVLILFVPVGVFLLTSNGSADADLAAEELQSSAVRQGDLVLLASGSGSLTPAREVELGFGTAGPVDQVLVQVGDTVEIGDILAIAGEQEQLAAAVAEDELALLEAEEALLNVIDGAELAAAQAQLALGNAQDVLEDAERTWQNQQEGYRGSSTTIKAAEAEVAVAQAAMERAEDAYNSIGGSSDDPQRAQAYKDFAAAQQRYWSALSSLNWYTGHPTETQQAILDGELALAEAQLEEAQRAYDEVKDGPSATDLAKAELMVTYAITDLAVSQANLEKSVIVAPFAGTVMDITADEGDSPNTTFITLADLSSPYIEVFLDETDADKFAIGYQAEVVFDAIPDSVFAGQVVQVDPSLNTQGNVSTLQGLVQLDVSMVDGLLVGMNAAVDVIGGRAEGVLLVPVESLRELGPGEYAVFILEDGEPRLTPVEVGLMDFSFAEIISGVEMGDRVTTGIVETG
jgi:HlyD family secretion protein